MKVDAASKLSSAELLEEYTRFEALCEKVPTPQNLAIRNAYLREIQSRAVDSLRKAVESEKKSQKWDSLVSSEIIELLAYHESDSKVSNLVVRFARSTFDLDLLPPGRDEVLRMLEQYVRTTSSK